MIPAISLSSGCSVGFLRTQPQILPGLQSFSLYSFMLRFFFFQNPPSLTFDFTVAHLQPEGSNDSSDGASLPSLPLPYPMPRGSCFCSAGHSFPLPQKPSQCIICPPASDRNKVWGMHFPLHFISDREAKPAPFLNLMFHIKNNKNRKLPWWSSG